MCASTPSTSIPDTQFFKDVFNTSPIGIAVENLDGQPLFVNPALCRFLGYSEEEFLNKHCVDFSLAEDAEKDWEQFQQLKAGQINHYQLDKRYVRRDGSLVWGSLSVSLLNNNSRTLVIAMVEDITDKKTAEDAMRESEARLRLAIQAGKMYAYEWDVINDVIVRSPEYVKVLGATEPRTLTHQQVLERIHPEDRAKLLEAVAKHSPTNPTVDVNYRVLLAGKDPVWIRSSGRAFFDREGRMTRLVGIVADITDQKVTEESLRKSEERLRLAQKVAGIGTFERNIRTGVLTWTPEMEFMHGLPPGGFGGTREAFENLVHPDDRAKVVELVEMAMKTGEPTNAEWRVVWPDGSVHWVAGRWQVLMDESGEPSRVVGADTDITNRKRAEEALADMTRKLVDAQEQERARIARELHDDIGQRLALLAVELEQLRQNPSEIEVRMQELRNQTSEISKDVQALSHDLHSSQLEYLGAVAGIRNWCKGFGERRGMQIDFRHDVQNPLPQEIGLCLFRVVQEALHNAARHSGVKRAEVQLEADSDQIYLVVRDSGRGFDVDAVQLRKGLGLTSMRERVRLVNGTIDVQSQPMGGTTIHVRVPFVLEQGLRRAAG
jgi:PAS domain S-box-containing protein